MPLVKNKKPKVSSLYVDNTLVVPQGAYAAIDLHKEKYLATQLKECIALVIKDNIDHTLTLLHIDLLTSKEALDYSLQEALPHLVETKSLSDRYTIKFFGANFNQISLESIQVAKNNVETLRKSIIFNNLTDLEFDAAFIHTNPNETWFRINAELEVSAWLYAKGKLSYKPGIILKEIFKDELFAKFYFYTSYRYIWDIYKIPLIPLINANECIMPSNDATLDIPGNFIAANYGLSRDAVVTLRQVDFLKKTKDAPENSEEIIARTFMLHTFLAAQKIAQDVAINLFAESLVTISDLDKNKTLKIITATLLSSKEGYQLFKLQFERGSILTQLVTEKIQPVFNLAIERLTFSGMFINTFSLSNIFGRPCCPNAKINFDKFNLRKVKEMLDLEAADIQSFHETSSTRKFNN